MEYLKNPWLRDKLHLCCVIFSSPELSGSQGELIVYTCSGVHCHCSGRRHQQFQTSSLKPLGQSKPNFMWSHLKVYIYGLGHMTKMAPMPIYGTNL